MQKCMLSPLLYSLYTAELNEIMRKRGIGGVEIGNIRIGNLTYADGIVLVAKIKK